MVMRAWVSPTHLYLSAPERMLVSIHDKGRVPDHQAAVMYIGAPFLKGVHL